EFLAQPAVGMPEAAARHRNRAFDEWQDFRNTEKDAAAELGIEPPRGFAPIYGFDIARALVVSLATASDRSQQLSRRRDAMVGFAGGFVGGAGSVADDLVRLARAAEGPTERPGSTVHRGNAAPGAAAHDISQNY